MILVRAPLRLSFVGGGTDMADFYRYYPGRVISSSINHAVYIVINGTPFINAISARYSKTETVVRPEDLAHPLIKAALLDLGIHGNIEIGSFASLPGKTGLGSSSSFSVALMRGLHLYLGRGIGKEETARLASRLEIDLVGEPIGKQDQYASAYGGLNMIQFNPDGSVMVEPILMDHRKKTEFNKHLLLFFTGIIRNASSVLGEQKTKISEKLETYKRMSDSVFNFRNKLLSGDMKELGKLLHEAWLLKKSLSPLISGSFIDELYASGLRGGAWGGKVAGAGGGGCILFCAPFDRHEEIRRAVRECAEKNGAQDFREVSFAFTQTGCDVLVNNPYTDK